MTKHSINNEEKLSHLNDTFENIRLKTTLSSITFFYRKHREMQYIHNLLIDNTNILMKSKLLNNLKEENVARNTRYNQ